MILSFKARIRARWHMQYAMKSSGEMEWMGVSNRKSTERELQPASHVGRKLTCGSWESNPRT